MTRFVAATQAGGQARLGAFALALLLSWLWAPALGAGELRAIWVTRYDYRSAEDVRQVMGDCARLGATRVLFQVRGQCDAYYASELEPWGELMGPGEPSFDPLAVAVAAAREAGLQLEAWINVMPLWKGTTPPRDRSHPFYAHPRWRVVGSDGARQRLNAHYVCVNPGDPAVRAHLAAVATDIVSRYAIDGLHLDYLRFVTDLEGRLDFSYDPKSLEDFGGDPAAEPARWRAFKEAQITEVLRSMRTAVRAARPSCVVSAAIYPTEETRRRVSQDVLSWAREGLVDALYPMAYAADEAAFEPRLADARRLVARLAGAGHARVRVLPGLGVYKQPQLAESLRQTAAVRAAGFPGFSLFCYASFFASRDSGELAAPVAARARRVAQLGALLRR